MVPAMNSAAIRSDWVGRIADGRFPLLQWLGGAEGGGVFLTEFQGQQPRKAAIKLFPADDASVEKRTAGWAAAASISHPHLMRLFHTGSCRIDAIPLLYAVTEFSGENLSEILPIRPLTPAETEEMIGPVVEALSYLHGKGFVHGHLKPSNIMVVDDVLKLSADSIQVAGNADGRLNAPSVYDPPERGAGPISTAADAWSLGVILVEALTQHPPKWDNGASRGDPQVSESLPQPFAAIIRECLRSNPARRCTLNDVRARLSPANPQPEPPAKTASAPPAQSDDARLVKSRGTALVVAALVVLAIVAALLFRSRTGPSPQPIAEQPHAAAPAPVPQPTGDQQSDPAAAKPSPSRSSPAQQPGSVLPAPPPPSPAPVNSSSNAATVKGAVAERVSPDLLPAAKASITGHVNVAVRVAVDSSGNVSDATFDSPGPSKYFAKVALQAAQRWRFTAPQVQGQPVSSTWILRFHFTQSETEMTPVEVSP
jgi:TonB family protein